jgi:hypothetical protein
MQPGRRCHPGCTCKRHDAGAKTTLLRDLDALVVELREWAKVARHEGEGYGRAAILVCADKVAAIVRKHRGLTAVAGPSTKQACSDA